MFEIKIKLLKSLISILYTIIIVPRHTEARYFTDLLRCLYEENNIVTKKKKKTRENNMKYGTQPIQI